MLTGSTPFDATGEPSRDLKRPVGLDPEHGDLVAAGVDGEQVAPVGAQLERALRRVGVTCAGATDRERRARDRGQRPVGEPVEGGDRVHGRRVVVDVDVPDDARRGGGGPPCGARAAAEPRLRRGRPSAQRRAATATVAIFVLSTF